ncbi:MAG TPA: BON domain-containing protein [Woeseiaceae bacterium]|nr:BON domain-containing protein [Woeseiaceae bacterium]
MRLLALPLYLLLAGCTAMLLGSGEAPTPEERSAVAHAADVEITTEVRQRLRTDPAFAAAGIGVSTYRGRVTLTGSVRSYAARQRAAELARGVDGVVSVDNRLQVSVD